MGVMTKNPAHAAGQGKAQAAANPRKFGAVVRDLLIDRNITTALGNPNWMEFSASMDAVHYESLRKAVTGERWPAPKIMEAVAKALDVDPTVFYEYRLWLAQRAFDPTEVGEDVALANLQKWTDSV